MHHDWRMEFQLAVSAPTDSHRYVIVVEPEAMHYEFPKEGKVVLAFRGPDSMLTELTHYPDAVLIWRPADTEVWATTADGNCAQIAGFAGTRHQQPPRTGHRSGPARVLPPPCPAGDQRPPPAGHHGRPTRDSPRPCPVGDRWLLGTELHRGLGHVRIAGVDLTLKPLRLGAPRIGHHHKRSRDPRPLWLDSAASTPSALANRTSRWTYQRFATTMSRSRGATVANGTPAWVFP